MIPVLYSLRIHGTLSLLKEERTRLKQGCYITVTVHQHETKKPRLSVRVIRFYERG